MTNQTHLFRHLDRAGSDQHATPRAENLKSRGPIVVLRSDLFTQINLPELTKLLWPTTMMLTSFVPVTKLLRQQ